MDGSRASKDDAGQWDYKYDKRDVKADGNVKAKATNKKTGETREQTVNVKPKPKPSPPDPCAPRHKCLMYDGAPPPPPPETQTGDGSELLQTTISSAANPHSTADMRRHLNPFGLVSIYAEFNLSTPVPKLVRSKSVTLVEAPEVFRWGLEKGDPLGVVVPRAPKSLLTISGWVKWTKPTEFKGRVPSAIASITRGSGWSNSFGAGSVALVVMETGEVQLQLGGIGGIRSNHGGVLKDGHWHHVASTWDGAHAVIYIDNTQTHGALTGQLAHDPEDQWTARPGWVRVRVRPEDHLTARAGWCPPGLATITTGAQVSQPISYFSGVLAHVRVWSGELLSATHVRMVRDAESELGSLNKDLVLLGTQLQQFGVGWTPGGSWPDRALSVKGALGPRDFSLSLWVQTSSGKDGALVCSCIPDTKWAKHNRALILSSGSISFDVGWQGRWGATQPVNDARWHHVGMSYAHQEHTLSLYIDGKTEPGWAHTVNLPDEPVGSKLMLGEACAGSLLPDKLLLWDGMLDGVLFHPGPVLHKCSLVL